MSDFDRKKWNAKFRGDPQAWAEPSKVVTSLQAYLPTGKAIDVAGGGGRHAIWLAQQGIEVTVADISAVGLALARERSCDLGLNLQLVEIDFQEELFPAGPWDLIFSHHYLHRPLFDIYSQMLATAGRLIVIQPTIVNLLQHKRPPRPFLLEPNELQTLVSELEILHYEEGWLDEGRHEATVVAEKR